MPSNDVVTMPFGRHKGTALAALETDYIEWLIGRELREPLRSAIRLEAHRRGLDGARNGLDCPIPVAPRDQADIIIELDAIVARVKAALERR